ncbi:MAG: GntR family transcriptional regulator [Betaproteobacteria bacterium]|nr:GntR family transcriptional regulator [Betaproteobacteria bacterium]
MPSTPASLVPRAPLTLSLAEQIAARLSERIVTGIYAPGRRIMEQAVAEEFVVSRGPVREALRLLEKDGLVTILPRRGALVTNLSIGEVEEIFDIRAMLNGLRDRLIAEDAEREHMLPALEAEVANLARCARDPALGDEYVETVSRIDRLLTGALGNRRLKTILDSLMLQTLRYRQLGLSTPARRKQSVQSWQKLVKVIREGNGEEAERIARARVTASRDAAIELLRRGTRKTAVPGKPSGSD